MRGHHICLLPVKVMFIYHPIVFVNYFRLIIL